MSYSHTAEQPDCPTEPPAPGVSRHGRLVRELLAAQLGIAAEEVDVERSFRELGVDHEAAVVLTTLLREAVGLHLSPTLVFTYRTPARLIAALDARTRTASPAGGDPAAGHTQEKK